MGFIFLLLFICVVIALISYWGCDGELDAGAVGFIVSAVISTLIMFIVWGDSYSGYLDMEKRVNVIEQYAQTVRTYAKRGVAEFQTTGGREITDLKYQNYQTQIGEMIIDLRDQISEYNQELIGKRIMKNSWFWSWCIVSAPEASVVLKMSNYIE